MMIYMPRTKGRDGSIIKHNHAKYGVPTSMHGHLAIELGSIPFSRPSPQTRFPQSFTPSSSTPSSSSTLLLLWPLLPQTPFHPFVRQWCRRMLTLIDPYCCILFIIPPIHFLNYHTILDLPHLIVPPVLYQFCHLWLQ